MSAVPHAGVELSTGLGLLLSAYWRSGVVLAAAAALAWTARRRPVLRHAVLAAGLLAGLLVPAADLALPELELRVLPARATTPVPMPELAVAPSAASPTGPIAASGARSLARGVLAREGARAGARPLRGLTVALTASLLTAGAALLMARHGRQLLLLRRLRLGARPLRGASWAQALAEARRRVGVRRRVVLAWAPGVEVPMTFGTFRPIVLMPAAAAGWSVERRRAVLMHELCHIERGDWQVLNLARLAQACYWANPLSWWLLDRLRHAQELACDQAVLDLGLRPSDYATHLVQIAHGVRARGSAPAAALAVVRRTNVEDRVMSILAHRRAPAPGRARSWSRFAAPAALVVLAAALATLRPVALAQNAESSARTARVVVLEPASEPTEPSEPTPPTEALAPQEPSTPSAPSAGRPELEALAAELAALEQSMRPFEKQMREIEQRMRPTHEQMQEIERSMRDQQRSMEEVQRRLESELRRTEEQQRASLEPYEEQMRQLQEQLQPFHERMTALEREMQPLVGELEAHMRELERRQREAGAPLRDEIRSIQQRLEPLQDQMEQLSRQLEPQHERMAQIEAQMRPTVEAVERLHEQLRPLEEQAQQMERQLRPFEAQMRAQQEKLQPLEQELRTLQEQMRPVQRQLELKAEQLRGALGEALERTLARELGEGVRSETLHRIAGDVAEAVSMSWNDATLRVRGSAPELRDIIRGDLGSEVAGLAPDAVERAAMAVLELEVRVEPSLRK